MKFTIMAFANMMNFKQYDNDEICLSVLWSNVAVNILSVMLG